MSRLVSITVLGLVALFGIALAIRGGLILGSDLSQADCVDELTRFQAALQATFDSSPDLPRDQVVSQGLDRETRSESRFACEVGFGRSTRRDLVVDTVVVERYSSESVAEAVLIDTEPGPVVEAYAAGRLYRDTHSGPEVLEPIREGTVTTFTSLHLIDCLIVRASWIRPLNDETLVESSDRDAWVRDQVGSMAGLCKPSDAA